MNFCFSQKRSYSAVVRCTYLEFRTSLRSCARAIEVTVQCHWSLVVSSFKMRKAEKSRFIPRLNKSTRDWDNKEEGVVAMDNGDGVASAGVVYIELTELNFLYLGYVSSKFI
jgi:hypothetical protein